MKWIKVGDVLPIEDQKVFYYFDVVGIFEGEYYGQDEHDCGPCFGGDSGWLCGDVTHWMPREEGDSLPERPNE